MVGILLKASIRNYFAWVEPATHQRPCKLEISYVLARVE